MKENMKEKIKSFLKRLFSKPKPVQDKTPSLSNRPTCYQANRTPEIPPQESDFGLRAKRFLEQPRTMREERIAELNRKRRTQFAHAEHFKQRQPTTARKLWNPQAKPVKEKDEENA
jgi:hypothetical protein